MPFTFLKLDELAKHIGMDAREVRKWAEKGDLPGQKVGGEWRFNRAELLDWLQREMHNLDEQVVRNLEKAMSDGATAHIIGQLLHPAGIEVELPARSRSSVLRELVVLAKKTELVFDDQELLSALQQREDLASTALAGGFALPHPRRPLPYATAEPLICIGIVPAGVPFGAPDGRLTDIFVLICSHDDRQHLRVLARLAMMFNSGTLADDLRGCRCAAEVLQVVNASETAAMSVR